MATDIGSVYERIDGDGPVCVEVVGVHGQNWIVADRYEFASPFEISPNDLRTFYGALGESVPRVDESAAWFTRDKMWKAQTKATQRVSRQEAEGESPNQVFERLDRERAAKAS
jgi:hypothetical protein